MAQLREGQETVAITGLACRFPGGHNLESFWQFLCEGKSAWSEMDSSRFHADAFWSEEKRRNKSITGGAHFLKQDFASFDANFFGISATEAGSMDPQHRIMIEVAYEALETAGYTLEDLAGTRTGVFMGHFTSDWKDTMYRDADAAPQYSATGPLASSFANRISWLWNLRGPSFCVDTACSSSLVALHLACQSLHTRESDIAIVGGSNLLINPDMFLFLSGQNFLSPDGKCKPFDASANGYGRGDGFAAIILKRAGDAIAASDPVRAMIRGTGVNQDGHTKALFLPSADAQAELISEVYRSAGLDFRETMYAEAHGTGTQAGDAEEALALSRTLSAPGVRNQKLLLGSVKGNIGHTEAAAGIASVIKGVLMLEHGIIPPTINHINPNPKIDFDTYQLRVQTKLTPWPTDGVRRLSINACGYGGTNAHAVLEDAYHYLQSRGKITPHFTKEGLVHRLKSSSYNERAKPTPRLIPISAQDRDGLKRVKSSLANYVRLKTPNLDDLAYTISSKRSRLQWKTFVTADSLEELASSLEVEDSGTVEYLSSRKPRIGFIFTGQGAQWPGMGAQLMDFPVFRSSVEAADEYLRTQLSCKWSAVEELKRGKATSRVGDALYSQALCTILQVALIDMLNHWSIKPVAVAGHSSGEIGAAYCAGYLTREDAWKVAYERGIVSGSLKTIVPELQGAMMAVGTSPEKAESFIERACQNGEVGVACVNSPSSVTLSGDAESIDKLETMFSEAGIFARKLRVDTAYHSHHMHRVARDYLERIADIRPITQSLRDITMHSSVIPGIVSPGELGAGYWVRNLISPVQFAQAVQNLVRPMVDGKHSTENAVDVLVEIGPHPALQGPSTQSLKGIGVTNMDYLSTLVRNANGIDLAISLAGNLVARGSPVDLVQVNAQDSSTYNPHLLVDLPAYPWSHTRRFWTESRMARGYRLREGSHKRLLGSRMSAVAAEEHVWRGHIRLSEEPWVSDHKIHGSILYPAAGFLAMAIEAALESADTTRQVTGLYLREIQFVAAMIVAPDSDGVEYTIILRPHLSGTRGTTSAWMEFSVASSPDGSSLTQNCLGLIQVKYDVSNQREDVTRELRLKDEKTVEQYQDAVSVCKVVRHTKDFYTKLDSLGLNYGEAFRNVTELHSRMGQSLGTVTIPDAGLNPNKRQRRPHVVHPTTLDAVFHLAFAATTANELRQPMVPRFLAELFVAVDMPFTAHAQLKGFSTSAKHGLKELRADINILDETQTRPVLTVTGLTCAEVVGPTSLKPINVSKKLCSKIVWRPAVDILTPEEINRAITSASCKDKIDANAEMQIAEYIKLLHHINPQLSILEFAQSESLWASLELDDIIDTAEYTVLCDTEHAADAVRETLPDRGVTCRASKIDEGILDYEKGRSDIIIASTMTVTSPQTDEKVKPLLKPGGKLCLLGDVKNTRTIEERLHSVGFSTLVSNKTASTKSYLILESPKEAGINGDKFSSDDEVMIIQVPQPSRAVQEVAMQFSIELAGMGYTTKLHTWGIDSISNIRRKPCVSLLELEKPILQDLEEVNFEGIKKLILDAGSVLWVVGVDAAAGAMINGLMRVVRNEVPGINLRTVNSPFCSASDSLIAAKRLAGLLARVFVSESTDNEFCIQDDVVKVSRIIEDLVINDELNRVSNDSKETDVVYRKALKDVPGPVKLAIGQMGILDSLRFEHDPLASTELKDDEIEVQVKATSLNFREVMVVMGQIPDTLLGFDAAGVVKRVGSSVDKFKVGDRVVMCEHGAHRTIHRAKASFCAHIPARLSFEQAASVPTVQATAWYGLVSLARVHRGQSILIHAAAGGVGQSAIQVAQHFGLEVFVTVGSKAKRELVRNEYGIPDDHIFNSRDLSFADGIRRMTGGKGVDVVLNSLTGEALRETWHCIAPFGYFIEIGLKDIQANTRIDMAPFARNVTFSFFNLNLIAREQPELFAAIIENTFDFLERGITRPVTPVITYSIGDIEGAFRLMQTGKHVGKISISYEDDAVVPVVRSTSHPQSLKLDSNASYVLVGGLGGLGRSLASLLVENGARKLCFLSRSGAKTLEAQRLMQELSASGVQALALECDVSVAVSLREALAKCVKDLGPVNGVIQCAMVLRDTLFTNMTYMQWVECTRPKVQGTWNLHVELPDVNFFIVLSSFAGIFGNRGQSNYAAAGAFQDALAHLRRSQNKKGLSLDLGIMRDIGVLAENGITESLREWEEPYGIRESEFSQFLKLAIAGDIAGTLDAQVVTGLATGGSVVSNNITEPFYLSDAKFAIMARMGLREQQQNSTMRANSVTDSVGGLVAKSTSVAEAAEHVKTALIQRVAKMLQTQTSEIDTSRPLHSYGIDSLVAIEVVNWAFKELKATLTVFDIMAAVPIMTTAAKMAAGSAWLSKEVAAAS
ncbi:hypothetical protein EYB26_007533 [Talaromyces marneffei]|uniref:uncharacterized protein n=1 Tax=Talaromyces marneffei TaxID=37727 RepID=UPI0012A7A9E9|nr:uncharacterized protein EYB26_007533 [Talaromyces marneffei]QGA19838.1 hypothetical protein EYB26_007533 [Talaromyces marneffei]